MCATISAAALGFSASKSYRLSTRSFCTRSLNEDGDRRLTLQSWTCEMWNDDVRPPLSIPLLSEGMKWMLGGEGSGSAGPDVGRRKN